MSEKLNFKSELEDTDTAIILDKDGNLKSLLLPNQDDTAIVPENIVKIIDFLMTGKEL